MQDGGPPRRVRHLSTSAAWKALERRCRKIFPGGVRLWRPDFSDSIPDGESDTDTWDAKCYERFSVISKFVEAEKKYRTYTNGRRFTLVLFSRDRPRAGDFILVRAKDWTDLLEKERELARVKRTVPVCW